MIEEPGRTTFRFTESVAVDGTNLEATAEQLDVLTRESEAPDASTGGSASDLTVERIVATGEVFIVQEGRVATGDSATILPDEGKVVLEGRAEVTDERGKVSGHRLTLLQGERRAMIEGGGPEKKRATISLPELPSGNL